MAARRRSEARAAEVGCPHVFRGQWTLSKPAEGFPEFGPSLAKIPAYEYVGVVADRSVPDAVAVCEVTS